MLEYRWLYSFCIKLYVGMLFLFYLNGIVLLLVYLLIMDVLIYFELVFYKLCVILRFMSYYIFVCDIWEGKE